MRQYEFSFTTTATGVQTTFTVSDCSEESPTATSTAIDETVARAIRKGLRNLATIENVVVTRISDERVTSRDSLTADPAP